MRAPISVIIPTLNAAGELPECLACLMEGLQAGVIRELIVSDGGSSDETCEIAREAGAQIVQGTASRGAQLRRGCAMAKGAWLLVLHADTQLDEGWTLPVLAQLENGSAACFRLQFRAVGVMPVLVAGWANLRSRLFGLPYGDQGLLVRRELYERVGGYPDQALMEDVALVRALRGKIHILPAYARTSAARYQQQGWLRRGSRNLWTLARYFCGADPKELSAVYKQ